MTRRPTSSTTGALEGIAVSVAVMIVLFLLSYVVF